MEHIPIRIAKALVTALILTIIYFVTHPHIKKLGSNGRAVAYITSMFSVPGILVASLAVAEVPFSVLAPVTGSLALGFSFGAKQAVENTATVFLNLSDDVYEVGDILSFQQDDDFYKVVAIKTSSIKLLSLGKGAGRILNISPSILAQKEIINYTQDGASNLCKWTFPISLKAPISQPGEADITKMEDALLKAAKEVQNWIIQNTKHPKAIAAFQAESQKDSGRKDVPAGVFLTKVEKFIHHYVVALWVPGIEIFRVNAIQNELLHRVWYYAVEFHNIELATSETHDTTDIVEATQAIAVSINQGLNQIINSNQIEQRKIEV